MWLLFAFLAAFFFAGHSFLVKRVRNMDPFVLTLGYLLSAMLCYFIFLIIGSGIPPIGARYVMALCVSGTLNIAGFLLFTSAISKGELSLMLPITNVTPMFLLITLPLIIGEMPGRLGIIGVFAIVIGSYILNTSHGKEGLFGPIKGLIVNRSAQKMLITSLLWSIAAPFDKIGITSTSPEFWVFTITVYMTTGIFVVICLNPCRKHLNQIKNNWKQLLLIGIVASLGGITLIIGYDIGPVQYVATIKQTGCILAVLMGYFFLNEKELRNKLIGSGVMIIGVFLIVMALK